MEDIILKARYGYKHVIKHIENNLWSIECDPKSSGYFRLIGNFPNNIVAIDPDGGPFLSVGDRVGDYTIKSIMSNGILELE